MPILIASILGTMETELPKYCHPKTIHNDHLYQLQEYQNLIQQSKDQVANLNFHIDTFTYNESSQK